MTQLYKSPKFRRGFKKWSDDKALEFRQDLGLRSIDPLCAFALCEHLGVPIKTPKDLPKLGQDVISHLLNEGSSEWHAATVPLPKSKYWILHNPNNSLARQQSDLMHEVGHIVCKHEVPPEKSSLRLSGFLRNLNPEQEDEADWLGSCLQLPRPALLNCLKRGLSIEEISECYNASKQMVTYRINITGVKKQLKYLRL